MITTCTMDALRGIRFGYSFMANQRTLKLRFTTAMAEAIMNRLPKHFHKMLAIHETRKNTTFIACIAHPDSAIWHAIEEAKRLAKADMLRLQADAIEHGMPMQLAMDLAVANISPSDDLPF